MNMNFLNTKQKYGLISISLHWFSAIIIIGLLSVGFYMTSIPFDRNIYNLHKSFGVLALMIFSLRFLWNYSSIKPVVNGNESIKKMAEFGHVMLYILMFAMPISGILMSLSAGYPVKFFNFFTIPSLGANSHLRMLFNSLHKLTAILLLITISIHIFMAFFHQFVLKDGTMKKMI
jgi:cytochrome b561